MKRAIYLDYNATTPIHKEVADLMMHMMSEHFGNPSSDHYYGLQARNIVDTARKQIADLVGCYKDEIIFTAGGTEANNVAIRGVVEALKGKGKHIITSSIEHPAVYEVCDYLETEGFKVSKAVVDEYGIVIPSELEKLITEETILITIMHSNNETGSLQPIEEIANIAADRNILFHSDAAQSIGKIRLNVKDLGLDLMSLTGHKFYAPKGIGALYIKRNTPLKRILFGASQENKLRPGTENVVAISAMGKAAELVIKNLDNNISHFSEMRDSLYNAIQEELITSGRFGPNDIKVNGHPQLRLVNTLNISFKGVHAKALSRMLKDKVAFSCGAACHTNEEYDSQVLKAMKVSNEFIRGSIRLSTGLGNTYEDIRQAASDISQAVCRLHSSMNPCNIVSSKDRKKIPEEIKLTHYTAGLGCACKIEPSVLEAIVKKIPILPDSKTLVGPEFSDDAAVYKVTDDKAIVLTLDFFNPIVDDPQQFGAIAAANSLSDIYAMGAKPLFALNIVGFPIDTLPQEVLSDILTGAIKKTNEAGIPILGGHSINDVEPKFGLAVAGIVHPDKIYKNNNAQVKDAIVLTKPLGVGIITSAMKKGLASDKQKNTAIELMCQLNKYVADLLSKFKVNSCTDITGFGLMGHLSELAIASKVNVLIDYQKVPQITGLKKLIAQDVVPGGIIKNIDFHGQRVQWSESIKISEKYILFDAQTSGGLLITMPKKDADEYVKQCYDSKLNSVAVIGEVLSLGEGKINII